VTHLLVPAWPFVRRTWCRTPPVASRALHCCHRAHGQLYDSRFFAALHCLPHCRHTSHALPAVCFPSQLFLLFLYTPCRLLRTLPATILHLDAADSPYRCCHNALFTSMPPLRFHPSSHPRYRCHLPRTTYARFTTCSSPYRTLLYSTAVLFRCY